MKTFLVPVDFSAASVHAAEYAAALSHQTDVEHIILLNAYYVSVYETMLPTPDMVQITEEEIEENAAERIRNLNHLKNKLADKVGPGVSIGVHLNRSHLLRAVVENAIDWHVDLVILGSKGNSSRSDVQIGSHVIKISKACPVPIIIVPPAYAFETVSRIVVACDFNKVIDNVPLEGLKRLLSKKKADLLVVNIDTKAQHNTKGPERMAEETSLYTMLKPYHPSYFYVNEPDIINGILKFASDQDAQLVIALPHKYSFLQSLLHNSVSQQLAESAAVPVLLLK